ncbi:MAG: S46 family peptidase, partial [Caulobacteraceae bacterium]
AAEERAKPAAERLAEYSDSRLALVEKNLLDPRPVERDLEQLQLTFWLTKAREYLTADAPEVRNLLGKESPEALSARLAASKLGDPAVRKALWEGGAAAIRASQDPMIRFVLATDLSARNLRKAYEARVSGPTDRAAERIARARFAVYGTSVYPDATFSLRLSYGAVSGWSYRGRDIPPLTYVDGLYDRATGQTPFALAPSWIAAKSKLDAKGAFDFATTNDIVGGNSGSPVINARGEVVGAAFDGNIHSLGGSFAYDGALNRTVVVSTAIATQALSKVYNKPDLVRELTGGS